MKFNVAILLAILIFVQLTPLDNCLAQIPCVSGFVYDSGDNPVIDADLDFDNALTGERIYTPNDNTDEFGFYRVCVFPGAYHISYAPPLFTHLLGRRYYNISLTAGQDLELNVTLDSGIAITGILTDSGGDPIGGVDIDADNIISGRRVYTPNDNSDSSTGEYWIVVPPADYRLRFQPPGGTRFRGLQLDSLSIYSDTTIDVVFEDGLLLSGIVSDIDGQGLNSITVDLRDQGTGEKIFLANDKTDSTGFYSVAAPEGVFVLRFEPEIGTRYVGVAIDSFEIIDDLNWNQELQEGYLVNISVEDSIGNPIPQADIDFIRSSTGNKIYTPHDKTDSIGTTIIAVTPDIYLIRVDPPIGSFYDRLSIDSVNIFSDTSFVFELQESERVNLTGKVVNVLGECLPDIKVDLISRLTGAKVYISNNTTDSTGQYNIFVPIGNFDAQFAPPQGSRYVGLMLKDIIISQDTVWSDVVLDTGLVFTAKVYNYQGAPIPDVDFDFNSETSDAEIITPHDNTDSSGFAQMTIPADIYTIIMSPPESSRYRIGQLSGFEISTDTSVILFLKSESVVTPLKFSLENNYPNPFNDATTISYILTEGSPTEIIIYNVLGQQIEKINNGYQSPGIYSISWLGRDFEGNQIASGIYFYQLVTKYGDTVKKMVLLK